MHTVIYHGTICNSRNLEKSLNVQQKRATTESTLIVQTTAHQAVSKGRRKISMDCCGVIIRMQLSEKAKGRIVCIF